MARERILRVTVLGDSRSAQKAMGALETGVSRTADGISSKFRNTSLAIGGALAFVGKSAVDYETAFTRIGAVSNASATDIEKWRGQVQELAGETARAPRELADALYFLASAGLETADIMPTLEMSAKAAAVGLGETQDIARLTANVLNAYADEGLTAAQATDTLVAAVKEGTAEPDEFADAMGRILPIASKAGVSFDEIAASLASLSNIGLDVNEGVTAMRGVLQALEAPGSQAAKAMDEVGISAQEMRDTIAEEGLLGALQLLEERTNGNIDKMKLIIPNIRGLTGALALTGDRADEAAESYARVADSTGALDGAFTKTTQDSGFKFQQLMIDLQNLSIELGNAFIPIAIKIAEVLQPIVEAFTKLPDGVQTAIVAFGLLVAAVSPVAKAISVLSKAIAGIKWVQAAAGMKAYAASLAAAALPVSGAATKTGILGLAMSKLPFLGVAAGAALAADALRKYGQTAEEEARHQDELFHGDDRVQDQIDVATGKAAARDLAKAMREAFDAATARIPTANKMLDGFVGALQDSAVAAEKASRKLTDFAGLTREGFKSWKNDVAGALDIVSGTLGDLAGKANLTVDKILAAFRKKLDAVTEFGDNIVKLADKGLSEFAAMTLAKMGEAGAYIAATLVDGTGKDVREFNRLLKTAEKAPKSLAGVVRGAFASMGPPIDAITGKVQRLIDKMNEAIRAASQVGAPGVLAAQHGGNSGGGGGGSGGGKGDGSVGTGVSQRQQQVTIYELDGKTVYQSTEKHGNRQRILLAGR